MCDGHAPHLPGGPQDALNIWPSSIALPGARRYSSFIRRNSARNLGCACDQPELLLYEPEKNGKLRLVAVEYIIPYTAHSRGAAPPVLFGQQFKQNDTFQLWGLHAWVWKENPSGIFANWNPRVTCEHTTAVASMSH